MQEKLSETTEEARRKMEGLKLKGQEYKDEAARNEPEAERISDHIQVKLVLLLPVDHPIVSSFDSVLNFYQGLEIASFDGSKLLGMDSGELSFNALLWNAFGCRES
nr:hypothetical protein CFP56_29383 [Quercus suber]